MFPSPKETKKKIQDNFLDIIFYSILALTVVMLALYAVASTLAASTLIGQIGLIISVFALVATTIVKRILNIKNSLEGARDLGKIPSLIRNGLITNLLGDLLLVTTGALNGISLLINITGGTPLNIFFFSAPFSNYIIPGIFLLYLVTAIVDVFNKYKIYRGAFSCKVDNKKILNQAIVKLIFSFAIFTLALLSCPAISSVIFGNISLSWLFGAAVAGSTLTPIFILGPLLIALTIAAIIYAAVSNRTLRKEQLPFHLPLGKELMDEQRDEVRNDSKPQKTDTIQLPPVLPSILPTKNEYQLKCTQTQDAQHPNKVTVSFSIPNAPTALQSDRSSNYYSWLVNGSYSLGSVEPKIELTFPQHPTQSDPWYVTAERFENGKLAWTSTQAVIITPNTAAKPTPQVPTPVSSAQ
jgi:hypothetical protein